MELDNDNQTTQKRRGRKPKTKEVEEEVAPKKRGRRPKDKSFTVINTYIIYWKSSYETFHDKVYYVIIGSIK